MNKISIVASSTSFHDGYFYPKYCQALKKTVDKWTMRQVLSDCLVSSAFLGIEYEYFSIQQNGSFYNDIFFAKWTLLTTPPFSWIEKYLFPILKKVKESVTTFCRSEKTMFTAVKLVLICIFYHLPKNGVIHQVGLWTVWSKIKSTSKNTDKEIHTILAKVRYYYLFFIHFLLF